MNAMKEITPSDTNWSLARAFPNAHESTTTQLLELDRIRKQMRYPTAACPLTLEERVKYCVGMCYTAQVIAQYKTVKSAVYNTWFDNGGYATNVIWYELIAKTYDTAKLMLAHTFELEKKLEQSNTEQRAQDTELYDPLVSIMMYTKRVAFKAWTTSEEILIHVPQYNEVSYDRVLNLMLSYFCWNKSVALHMHPPIQQSINTGGPMYADYKLLGEDTHWNDGELQQDVLQERIKMSVSAYMFGCKSSDLQHAAELEDGEYIQNAFAAPLNTTAIPQPETELYRLRKHKAFKTHPIFTTCFSTTNVNSGSAISIVASKVKTSVEDEANADSMAEKECVSWIEAAKYLFLFDSANHYTGMPNEYKTKGLELYMCADQNECLLETGSHLRESYEVYLASDTCTLRKQDIAHTIKKLVEKTEQYIQPDLKELESICLLPHRGWILDDAAQTKEDEENGVHQVPSDTPYLSMETLRDHDKNK